MTLPPDRGHVRTEHRHDRSHGLDALSTSDAIRLLIDDHRQVTMALAAIVEPLTSFVEALVARLQRGGRLVYVGAGTSGRLGVLDAAECPPTFQSDPDRIIGVIAGGDDALRASSERREDDPRGAEPELAALALTPEDTLLGIAAGGTTPYVLGTLPIARQAGALTGLLTCAAPSAPIAVCDHLLVIETGPELLTGSTRLKAGSATKLALNVITTIAFTRLGKVYSNLMVDLRATNDKLHDRALRILEELCPELSRDGADALLRSADGHLKTAILMQRLGVDASTAAAALEETGGHLRPLLEAVILRS